MVTMSADGETSAKQRVEEYLSKMEGDENSLAVEGLRFLRGTAQSETYER
jgi:hypothetical protein